MSSVTGVSAYKRLDPKLKFIVQDMFRGAGEPEWYPTSRTEHPGDVAMFVARYVKDGRVVAHAILDETQPPPNVTRLAAPLSYVPDERARPTLDRGNTYERMAGFVKLTIRAEHVVDVGLRITDPSTHTTVIAGAMYGANVVDFERRVDVWVESWPSVDRRAVREVLSYDLPDPRSQQALDMVALGWSVSFAVRTVGAPIITVDPS